MALANRSITPPSHPARATTVSRPTGGDPLRTFTEVEQQEIC